MHGACNQVVRAPGSLSCIKRYRGLCFVPGPSPTPPDEAACCSQHWGGGAWRGNCSARGFLS
eukprot:9381337-Alexandrium_andersonii.AAC.1